MPDAPPPLLQHLRAIYGETPAPLIHERVRALMDRHRPALASLPTAARLTERDAVLITYADQVQAPGQPPLAALTDLCLERLAGLVSGIHILPFYPWSSDDGFSVKDYRAVDPAYGDWAEVERLGRGFRLMFDAVINHASAQGAWFQAFLRDDPRFRDFFVTVEGDPDLSRVIRPRALPLLTRFETSTGARMVWTTFSADQVDLNYGNPEVLLEVLDVLLGYVARGASLIRLDAVAFLWKQPGTSCLHLPETHRVVQLLRTFLDELAPGVALITETNVPHADNVSYFGDGTNEAGLVYNFALPPLALDALIHGRSERLQAWLRGLSLPSPQVTFFNFLASHDGVGLNPARGLLAVDEIEDLVRTVLARGGRVSYKHNPDGTQSPYELNVSYYDALVDPAAGEPLALQVARFLASQAIMLGLVGVPGIYFHSLFGSRGWPEGALRTGHNRTINRQKLTREELERELADSSSRRARVLDGYARLLRARRESRAFDPYGTQQVLGSGDGLLALLRTSPGRDQRVLCLHNLTSRPSAWQPDASAAAQLPAPIASSNDLLEGPPLPRADRVELGPYAVRWLAF